MTSGSLQTDKILNFQLRTADHSDIDRWIEHIQLLHYRTMDLTLDRVTDVINRITKDGIPFLVVTVAGTNGKGSVATMLESIFRHAGYVTGLYTSPHLVHINERFVVSGQPISDSELIEEFERVEKIRENVPLTFFEYGTAIAIDYFIRRKVDVAILEVGLGGRKDAVNVLNAELACITSIGTDHEKWLGSDREQIGFEKAGILRSDQLAVCTDRNLPESIRSAAGELSLNLYVNGEDFSAHVHEFDWSWTSSCNGFENGIDSIPLPSIPGNCQQDNSAGAVMIAVLARKYLNISDEAIRTGVGSSVLEGRLQLVQKSPQILLDVAHNIESVRELSAFLAEHPVEGRNIAIMSVLSEKPIEIMVDSIKSVIDQWHLCGIQDKRGITARKLFRRVQPVLDSIAPVHLHYDVTEAFNAARSIVQPHDRIVVFGSFLTVGDILQKYRGGSAHVC